ncbi:MAG TPA: SMP-30/gluconolactonase/LRE family protein [Ilumatobacter sp.]|nr:SMP-30/gluconolactonase/LRE family protein [Ilumatobacter sp.]
MTEIITTGVRAPEGPVLLPDGRIAFVEQARGQVSVWDGGSVDVVATGPGAWNGLTLGADGALYGAQNGGAAGGWADRGVHTAGIERIGLDGSVARVTTSLGGTAPVAPNDLAFGPDGQLYFTDPAHAYNPDAPGTPGRLFVAGPGGQANVLIELDACYCNGIGFLADGALVWVESYGRYVCTLDDDGGRRVICQLPDEHVPDGFAVASDGRIFIATVFSHGVTVISPDGELLDHLPCGDDGLVTNCCFVGSDLIVTDFGPDLVNDPDAGRLWRVPTDATGLALHAGAL